MRAALPLVARFVTRVEEVSLAGGILLLASLTIANVIGRSVFGESLAAAEELSRFAMVFVTFMGLGYAAARARHIRMSALHDALPLRGRKVLMSIVTGTTCLLLLWLTAVAVEYVLGTVAPLGAVSPVLRVPIAYVYACAPLGLLLAALQYALAFAKNLTSPGVHLAFDVPESAIDGSAGDAGAV